MENRIKVCVKVGINVRILHVRHPHSHIRITPVAANNIINKHTQARAYDPYCGTIKFYAEVNRQL